MIQVKCLIFLFIKILIIKDNYCFLFFKSDIEYLCELFVNEFSKPSRNVSELFQMLKLVQQLFEQLTSKFSSEWRIICRVIEVFSILHCLFEKLNNKSVQRDADVGEQMSREFLKRVSNWMDEEFNDSLLICNELRNRSQSEWDQRERAVRDYENSKKLNSNKPDTKIKASFLSLNKVLTTC